jgi:diguanylate cyclase
VCRFGGEEFLALLPETDREGADKVVANLAAGLNKAAIRHAESPTGIVTISIGVVVLTERFELELGYEHGLKRADQALYKAKRAGRNQAHFCKPSHDDNPMQNRQSTATTGQPLEDTP